MKCYCCGASLGMFKKYVTLSDGAICFNCFKDLGFDVDKKDEYIDATCREIQSGYNHYANKQMKQILEEHGLPTLNFAHYGEERDVNATDEEKQIFAIVRDMFKAKGYDPMQLDLTRKSDSYVTVALGDFDVIRMKYTDRAKWITIPYAEAKAERHHIEAPEDVRQFDDLLNGNLAYISRYADIKKEGR